MLEKIKEFLDSRNWIYAENRDTNVISFALNGNNGSFQCAIDVREDFNTFLFVTFNGTGCPPDRIAVILDLINQLNIYISYGNFEMDIISRQIKFRTSIIVYGFNLSNQIIAEVIDRNTFFMDYTSPYFMKVMFGSMNASDAYKELIPDSSTKEIEQ